MLSDEYKDALFLSLQNKRMDPKAIRQLVKKYTSISMETSRSNGYSPHKLRATAATSLIQNGFIPVISPVGGDKAGNTYNINADIAAVEIAIKLNAAKLVFLTDIEGIRMDENNPESLISKIKPQSALELIEKGNIKGGMIPKTECCVKAVQNGVDSVHIINGKISHSILLEIYTKDGIGTVIEEE